MTLEYRPRRMRDGDTGRPLAMVCPGCKSRDLAVDDIDPADLRVLCHCGRTARWIDAADPAGRWLHPATEEQANPGQRPAHTVRLTAAQTTVLAVLRQMPERRGDSHDIADAARIDANAAATRAKELEAVGLVYRAGTRKGRRNRTVTLWRAAA